MEIIGKAGNANQFLIIKMHENDAMTINRLIGVFDRLSNPDRRRADAIDMESGMQALTIFSEQLSDAVWTSEISNHPCVVRLTVERVIDLVAKGDSAK